MTFFIISTFIKNSKKNQRFNAFYSFILMSVSSIIGLFISNRIFVEVDTHYQTFILFFIFLSIFNLYFSYNSSLLLRYRKKKYYEHEAIYAFFCYFGDWIFIFWRDLLKHSRLYKKAKLRHKMAKKQKKAFI